MNQIEMDAIIACTEILPEKSKNRYNETYKMFKDWCHQRYVESISESVMLAYFRDRSMKLKSPNSLWCEYSMLKTTIFINENEDISKYPKLKGFLKRKNDGFKTKKSSIFTREEMNKFLIEASDDTYLLMKVVMIMGIAGACRKDELVKMKIQDVENKNDVIIIKIPDTKNGLKRSFTIIAKEEYPINFMLIIKKYIGLRLENITNDRFFLKYSFGKCRNQPVGKNTLAKIPSQIAKYLSLENPTTYTGHSFRRTSATLLADSGIDVLGLKRHGGWKSSTVAESYVSDSMINKVQIADRILYKQNITEAVCSTVIQKNEKKVDDSIRNPTINNVDIIENINLPSKKEDSIVQIANCSNCSFTFNITKS